MLLFDQKKFSQPDFFAEIHCICLILLNFTLELKLLSRGCVELLVPKKRGLSSLTSIFIWSFDVQKKAGKRKMFKNIQFPNFLIISLITSCQVLLTAFILQSIRAEDKNHKQVTSRGTFWWQLFTGNLDFPRKNCFFLLYDMENWQLQSL